MFGAYQASGKIVAAWRFDLADPSTYPVRSLTTQYQESNMAFAERLMSEAGLFCFFEHEGDAARPGLGKHTLVIGDHNDAFRPNAQRTVRFTQPGAVMKEDSIDRWRSETRLQIDGIEMQSWDYRKRDSRPVTAMGTDISDAALVSRESAGMYAYPDRSHGQRMWTTACRHWRRGAMSLSALARFAPFRPVRPLFLRTILRMTRPTATTPGPLPSRAQST